MPEHWAQWRTGGGLGLGVDGVGGVGGLGGSGPMWKVAVRPADTLVDAEIASVLLPPFRYLIFYLAA